MLKTVHRYKVYHDRNLDDLEKKVNFMLNSGWVLAGGVCVDKDNIYTQAMTYTTEEEVPSANADGSSQFDE